MATIAVYWELELLKKGGNMGLYKNENNSLSLLAGSTIYADGPVGAIYPYGGSTAPQGFLICDGTELLRTEYPALFAVIGTSFGTPSDDTKFKIPDLRGEFLRGAGTNSHANQGNGGSVGAHQDATTVDSTYLASSGSYQTGGNQDGLNVVNADKITSAPFSIITNGGIAAGAVSHRSAVRPTNTSVNYIIKALEIALPTDFEDAVDDKIAPISAVIPSTATSANKLLTRTEAMPNSGLIFIGTTGIQIDSQSATTTWKNVMIALTTKLKQWAIDNTSTGDYFSFLSFTLGGGLYLSEYTDILDCNVLRGSDWGFYASAHSATVPRSDYDAYMTNLSANLGLIRTYIDSNSIQSAIILNETKGAAGADTFWIKRYKAIGCKWT